MNTAIANEDLDWFQKWIGPWLPTIEHLEYKGKPGVRFGKLAMSMEGAGKRRIFAIGNYVKQRQLRPYHDWLARLLSRIPNDGTYDQTAPSLPPKKSAIEVSPVMCCLTDSLAQEEGISFSKSAVFVAVRAFSPGYLSREGAAS
jgi:hypothetical protein